MKVNKFNLFQSTLIAIKSEEQTSEKATGSQLSSQNAIRFVRCAMEQKIHYILYHCVHQEDKHT